MKLKSWLQEYKAMTYGEYKNLSDIDRSILLSEHQRFCQREQRHAAGNWRPMTPEEAEHFRAMAEREQARYADSHKIGGIDMLGNYTALHHRWE